MDACKLEPLATTAFLQKRALNVDGLRSPRVSTEKNNATRPTKEASSRFKTELASAPSSKPIVPKRCSSPTAAQTPPSPGTTQSKRATSADRKRLTTSSQRSSSTQSAKPSTPNSASSRSTTPVRDTVIESHNTLRHSGGRTPDGLWPSVRNLSSSVTTAVGKKEKAVRDSSSLTAKSPANGLAERKRSPLRGRNTPDQSENSKPLENSSSKIIDQHRWPSMLGGKLSRSGDLTDKTNTSVLSSRGVVSPRRTTSDVPSRSPQQSSAKVSRRLSLDGNPRVDQEMKTGLCSARSSESPTSSAARHGRSQSSGAEKDKVSAVATSSQTSERSLNGANMQTESSSSVRSASPGPRFVRPSSPAARFCRPSSPVPNVNRSSSPSKAFATSSSGRGVSSPSRTRPSSTTNSLSVNTSNRIGGPSSILNCISSLQKGKRKANHLENSHLLKLLYNVYLHWRFVNDQSDEIMMIQKMRAENALQNTRNIISTLYDSVVEKRIAVQNLQQEMKLGTILNEQLEYLQLWAALESEHSISLSEAFEALKASTIRLPVTEARADIFDVKNAVSSAVDIMQAMSASICYLIAKVEGSKSLLSDLSIIAEKEKTILDECRELLGTAAALQVQESSLVTHLLQVQQDA